MVWEEKDQFQEIAKQIETGDHSHVIAVGGDGTVNAVAACLVGKNKVLGIIPAGSGNGLARSLGISMDPSKAIQEMAAASAVYIDFGLVNNRPFFCTSGIGFDARIGALFSNSKRRGLFSYISITLKELFLYRAESYEIRMNDDIFVRKAFLLTVANAGQYGNDFYIAPEAKMSDGLFHLVILKPFSVFTVFGILFRILNKEAHLSPYIETHSASNIFVKRLHAGSIHFDGEPVQDEKEIRFNIQVRALKVLTGANYRQEANID
jgi:YegS/Rv2252/BmrU family lipid kinase